MVVFTIYQYQSLLLLTANWVIFRVLTDTEIESRYPGRRIRKDNKRIFVMNTVFNLAETCLVAALIDYYEARAEVVEDGKGVRYRGNLLTYCNIFKVSTLN